jgi:hypothetical protein
MHRVAGCLAALSCLFAVLRAGAEDAAAAKAAGSIAERRLEVMTARIQSVAVSSTDDEIPDTLQPEPLFRYDDETRGYVDGTVWRLGATGRPLAIVTAELHPNYLGSGPRVVYDLLSLTDRPFTAVGDDFAWSPGRSAVEMQPLIGAPAPAADSGRRLTQLKEQARRFSGTQEVMELDTTHVDLRLLPKAIDRYTPGAQDGADGAVFLLVNGRNPAMILVVETDGTAWQYGVGRLSLPSELELKLDGAPVWRARRNENSGSGGPYYALNASVTIP